MTDNDQVGPHLASGFGDFVYRVMKPYATCRLNPPRLQALHAFFENSFGFLFLLGKQGRRIKTICKRHIIRGRENCQ